MPTITEKKNTLSQVIKQQGADAATVALYTEFLDAVQSRLGKQGKSVRIQTHIRGVTAYGSGG